MAKKQEQEVIGTKMRYSDQELGIIKTSFAGNLDLMVLFRKFLLDGDMTPQEQNILDGFTSNEVVVDILEKAVNPKMDKLAPAFQTVDLFSNFNFEPTPVDHAVQVFKSRVLAVEYLTQRFDIIRGKKTTKGIIHFDSLSVPVEGNDNQTYLNIMARNFMLSHIDTQLFNSLMIIAGEKDESPEEQKRRLTMDSSK